METKKMNLANIQGKLSRSELKNIMAGAEEEDTKINFGSCNDGSDSWEYNPSVTTAVCRADVEERCIGGKGTCGGSGLN